MEDKEHQYTKMTSFARISKPEEASNKTLLIRFISWKKKVGIFKNKL